MSYSFYSLVSSIKDKSSQAMATLSSDLKDFTAIIQEDAAEVATTVRKTVQEKSEAMRQRAEEDATREHSEEDGEPSSSTTGDDEQIEGKPRAVSTASSTASADNVQSEQQTASSKINSIFSSIGGYTLETSFGKLNFGEVGSKLLHTADELLGSLAGEHESGDEEEDELAKENALAARRFRLLALQEDPETYVEPPLDAETFAKWKAATPSDELETVKVEVLEHYPAVVEKFSELVPSVVEADDFWAHYIYKTSLLAAQEQRGADLLEHALNDSEEEIGWDVDSPRNDDSERKKSTSGSFFAEEETKEDDRDVASQPAAGSADVDAPQKPDSSSSDGESWIELDERKDQLAPLSSSSVASSVHEAKLVSAAAGAASAAKAKSSDSVAASGDDDEEELDWGDDDLIPEEVLSGDEASTAASAPAFREEPKRRAGDWGEWD